MGSETIKGASTKPREKVVDIPLRTRCVELALQASIGSMIVIYDGTGLVRLASTIEDYITGEK